MKSLMYKSPRVYESVIRLLHGSTLDERYMVIADKIGGDRRVLDVGCGTGLLAKYLYWGCEYRGLDLNEKFLGHAEKQGLNVHRGDVFDEKNYVKSDVIVLCDILHHVTPKHDQLLNICKEKADMVVVCEQYNGDGIMGKIMNKFRSMKWYHNLLGDSDGINEFNSMRAWNDFNRETVVSILDAHKASDLTFLGSHVIGVIEKTRD